MGKSSAPQAPNPYTSAQAQYTYGTEAAGYNAALNNVNTQGPTGSSSYQITGHDPTTGAPIYTQTTSLSAPEQAILSGTQGQQLGQIGAAGTALGQLGQTQASGAPQINPVQYGAGNVAPVQTSLNTSGVPGIADVSGLEQYGQNTALQGELAAINPSLDQQREQLDASLRNSGATPGNPAYDNAMQALDASQTQQRTQAAGQAITAGTGLQSTNYGESANTNSQLFGQAAQAMSANNAGQAQQFGQGAQSAELSNSAGQTALANWAQELGIPLSEITGLMGGTGVTNPTQTTPTTSQVSAPNIMSAFQNQYAGQLAGYNANVASQNTDLSGLASLAAAAVLA